MQNPFLTIFVLFSFHPIHVSICEVEYDVNRKALEISQRTFIDDLEAHLGKERGVENFHIPWNNTTETKKILESYFIRNLEFFPDMKPAKFTFLGYEKEDDAVFCYFEIAGIKKMKSLEVKNSVLLDYYDDQINLVHIKRGDYNKSLRLEGRKIRDHVTFQ